MQHSGLLIVNASIPGMRMGHPGVRKGDRTACSDPCPWSTNRSSSDPKWIHTLHAAAQPACSPIHARTLKDRDLHQHLSAVQHSILQTQHALSNNSHRCDPGSNRNCDGWPIPGAWVSPDDKFPGPERICQTGNNLGKSSWCTPPNMSRKVGWTYSTTQGPRHSSVALCTTGPYIKVFTNFIN